MTENPSPIAIGGGSIPRGTTKKRMRVKAKADTLILFLQV